jgi:hypothetical protein
MDEALFARPYYQTIPREFRLRVFHHDIPLMVMTYIGTLKTLVFWPLIALFQSGFRDHPTAAAWVIRLPMVLAGALTVFIVFYLTNRSASRPAAVVAALLLASDPTFLLTNTFDWGPVALEHLLLVTGCFFLVKYAQNEHERDLPLGFFFLGLALWNKAVFVWALAGLAVAAVSVLRHEVSKLTTGRHLAVAAAGFLIGAFPFVIYNGHRRAETFRSTGHLEPRAAAAKFVQFRHALDGQGLYSYLVSEEWAEHPKPATSLHGRAAAYIRDHWGEHRHSGMEWAAALSLLAFPLWWRSRAAWFALIFCTISWFFMASTHDAGASVHHTVLLWPFPQLFVAIAISSIPWKWLPVAITTVLVASNLLCISQYVSQFERNGADATFTDAVNALSASIGDVPGQTVYALDWGIENPLNILHGGRLQLRAGHDPFTEDTMSDWAKGAASRIFADPGALFVTHVAKLEVFTGVRERFDRAAAASGCRESNLRTIPDSNGRPIFELFQLACGSP